MGYRVKCAYSAVAASFVGTTELIELANEELVKGKAWRVIEEAGGNVSLRTLEAVTWRSSRD